MKKIITSGFGLLLFSMAIGQMTSFHDFYLIIYSHINPVVSGVNPFGVFVLPLAAAIVVMELAGAIGLLLLDTENVLRQFVVKIGLVVAVLWFALMSYAVIRNHPMAQAGFFGGHIRQMVGWFTLVQSLFLVAWAWLAYVLSEQEDNAS